MAIYCAPGADGVNPSKDSVIEMVAQSQPPSLKYLDTLCDFVSLYGGGPGAPMVRYHDAHHIVVIIMQ